MRRLGSALHSNVFGHPQGPYSLLIKTTVGWIITTAIVVTTWILKSELSSCAFVRRQLRACDDESLWGVAL